LSKLTDLMVKTFILFLVLIFSSTDINLVSKSKTSYFRLLLLQSEFFFYYLVQSPDGQKKEIITVKF